MREHEQARAGRQNGRRAPDRNVDSSRPAGPGRAASWHGRRSDAAANASPSRRPQTDEREERDPPAACQGVEPPPVATKTVPASARTSLIQSLDGQARRGWPNSLGRREVRSFSSRSITVAGTFPTHDRRAIPGPYRAAVCDNGRAPDVPCRLASPLACRCSRANGRGEWPVLPAASAFYTAAASRSAVVCASFANT